MHWDMLRCAKLWAVLCRNSYVAQMRYIEQTWANNVCSISWFCCVSEAFFRQGTKHGVWVHAYSIHTLLLLLLLLLIFFPCAACALLLRWVCCTLTVLPLCANTVWLAGCRWIVSYIILILRYKLFMLQRTRYINICVYVYAHALARSLERCTQRPEPWWMRERQRGS